MYSNATFVQSYIIIAVVLEIYRITLLSNLNQLYSFAIIVLEIYRITLLSNRRSSTTPGWMVLEIYRITLLSNTYTSGLSACLTFSSISRTVIIEGLLLPFDFPLAEGGGSNPSLSI